MAVRKRVNPVHLLGYVCFILICVIVIAPLCLMVVNSFKSNSEMLRNDAGLPEVWTLESYVSIFTTYGSLVRHFVNSVIISVISTAIGTFVCTIAAYAFAKYRFRGRNVIFLVLLSTLMIPVEVVIPGQYMLFAKMGLINTLTVQILPTIPAVVGVYMIRQYMLGIPTSLIESARMDGAGHVRTFVSIVMPSAKPIVSSYLVLHFLDVWQNYTWPVLVATKQDVMPIMVSLPTLVDSVIGFVPVWGTIMAGSVLCSAPLIIIFLINQKSLMQSVVLGAIKG